MTPTTQNVAAPSTTAPASAYRMVVAWSFVLLLVFMLGNTRAGAVVVYYMLLLIIFLLLVTHYVQLKAIVAPIKAPLS